MRRVALLSMVLIGFVVAGLGLVVESWPMFWVGVACAPIGGVAGLVMSRMGLGAEAAGH